VLFAAVGLLFLGQYPRVLYDLVRGRNRWLYRVIVYVALMRDDYPAFRLDQGGSEPGPGRRRRPRPRTARCVSPGREPPERTDLAGTPG